MSGPSDPDIAFAVLPNDRAVTIVDVFLTAGQKFWSTSTTAGNAMFLLESNPGSPATFIRKPEPGLGVVTLRSGRLHAVDGELHRVARDRDDR